MPAQSNIHSTMKKHILLIDDEADVRDVLSQALTVKGYRVSTAGAGHEALGLIKRDAPNLIVCDLQMEDADGLELIEQIKNSLPNLPVILLTGMIFDADVIQNTINKKVSCYIEKTSSLQRVTQEVQRLLGDLKTPSSATAGI
jgi:DNA-binding NtrC family response regulator